MIQDKINKPILEDILPLLLGPTVTGEDPYTHSFGEFKVVPQWFFLPPQIDVRRFKTNQKITIAFPTSTPEQSLDFKFRIIKRNFKKHRLFLLPI